MAKRNSGKIRQYRKPLNLNLGIIIFGVIFIYIVICVFLYFTSKHVMRYEVKTGSLSVNNVYEAIAIREEKIVESTDSGYINYYAREGERASVGDMVCSVDESGQLKEMIEDTALESGGLTERDYAQLRSEIMGFMGRFDSSQFQEAYDFKYGMEGTALKLANVNILDSLAAINSAGGGQLISINRAPSSGIVVYSTDGYEDLTADQVTSEMFEDEEYSKRQPANNELIESGDALYKLVTDENWSLVILVDEEKAKALEEAQFVQVRFLKDQCTSWGEVTILHNTDGNIYAKLDFNNSMISFCTDRFVDIELILEDQKGLKVPNSAIAEKEFFLVPKEYVTKGGNSSGYGVLRVVYAEDGSTSTEFVSTSLYHETEDEYYIDHSILKAGDNILKPDSTDQFTLSKSDTLKGVYNINKGYVDFKEIQVLYDNDEYSIVQPNTTYGLSAYDYIVLDAETVDVDELTYK